MRDATASVGSARQARRVSTRREGDTGDPRKIGEILDPPWRGSTRATRRGRTARGRARPATPVAANARPRSFARGVLTVECASSIWAQELTYLGGQLLARMNELDPAHPVQRFRFVTRRSPAPAAGPPPAGRRAPGVEQVQT